MINKRQEAFISEYCITLNATQSAIKAGYTPKNARTTAVQLLANPNIKQKVDEMLKEKASRNSLSADMVLNELKSIAFDRTNKVSDRIRALDLLGKHLKLFTCKIEAEVNTDTEIKVMLEGKLKDWAK